MVFTPTDGESRSSNKTSSYFFGHRFEPTRLLAETTSFGHGNNVFLSYRQCCILEALQTHKKWRALSMKGDVAGTNSNFSWVRLIPCTKVRPGACTSQHTFNVRCSPKGMSSSWAFIRVYHATANMEWIKYRGFHIIYTYKSLVDSIYLCRRVIQHFSGRQIYKMVPPR